MALTEEQRKALGGSVYDQQNFSDEELQTAAKMREQGDHLGVEKIRESHGYYGGQDGSQYIDAKGADAYWLPQDKLYMNQQEQDYVGNLKAQEKAGLISTGAANSGAETVRKNYNYSGGQYGNEYKPFKLADGNEKFSYKGAPSYVSNNADMINNMYNQLINRGKFSYNAETDPLYQNYADQYTRNGSRAMQDTLAQISSRTGGLASSYAGTAAQQTYGNYMQALNDKIPELYQLAYSMWRDEGNEMRDNLNLLRDMDRDEFEKYKVQLGQFNTDRSFANDNYWNDLSYNNNIAQQQLAKDQWNQEFKWNQESTVAQLAAQLLQAGISPSTLKQYLNFSDGSGGGFSVQSADGSSIGTDSAEFTLFGSATGTVVTAGEMNEGTANKVTETAVNEILTTDAPTPTISAQAQEQYAQSETTQRHFADMLSDDGGSYSGSAVTSGGTSSGSGYRSYASMLSGSNKAPSYVAGSKASKRGSNNPYSGNYNAGSAKMPEGIDVPYGGEVEWVTKFKSGEYRFSSDFGMRNHPISHTWKMHQGVDIGAPQGAAVQAIVAGEVIQAWDSGNGYGNAVNIRDENGYTYLYAHNSAVNVKKGDIVKPGDLIALVGSTGNSTGAHIHFEVRDPNGVAVDPKPWIEAYKYEPEPEEKEEAGAQGAAAANGGKSSAELPSKSGSSSELAGGILSKAKDAAKSKGKEIKESYKKVKKGETESQKKTKKKPKQNVSSTTGKEITSNSKESKKINKNKALGKLATLTKAAAAAKKAGKK